jgi:hypothetical protein
MSTDTTYAVPGARTSRSYTASWDIRSALRLRWRRRHKPVASQPAGPVRPETPTVAFTSMTRGF